MSLLPNNSNISGFSTLLSAIKSDFVSGFWFSTFGYGYDYSKSTGDAYSSVSITERRTIPTPALLPGLIGLTAVTLRKRKSEAAKQAETVEV